MESFFDFLIDNPVIAIILITWIFSALFGKKNKEKKAAEKAKQKEKLANATAGTKSPFRDAISKLEEAIDQAERKAETPKPPKVPKKAKAPVSQPAPETQIARISAPAERSSDPYAFRSLFKPEDRTLEGKDYDSTAKDYDLTADDYDLTAKDYDVTVKNYDASVKGFDGSSDSYAFHSVTKQPAKQDYHLTNFRAFQAAHGLSKQERAEGRHQPARPSTASLAASLFSSPTDVRRAFIMQEILNRPRALRR